MRVAEILAEGVVALQEAQIEGAARDARWLLAHALGVAQDRVSLLAHDAISDEAASCFRQAITQRVARQPVAQIIGARLFWGRSFRVTPDVLDPRPETETLIATALELPWQTVLDLGTGSGAILLSLLAERAGATGLGVDLSEAALAVAQENAARLGLERRATFQHSDWYAAVEGRFDLIVSNPPYIAAPDHATLAPETRDWEPRMALVPRGCTGDGLSDYARIAAQATQYMAPGGWLVVETGLGQTEAVGALLEAKGLSSVQSHDDLTGRARVVMAQRPASA